MSYSSCCRPLIVFPNKCTGKIHRHNIEFRVFAVYDSLVRLTHYKLKSAINGKVKNKRQISCLNICRRDFFIVQEVLFDGHSIGSRVQTSKLKHQLIYIFLSIIGSIRVRGSVCYVIYKVRNGLISYHL